MKLRYVLGITVLTFVIAIGIGLYHKSFYKDFNDEERPLENFKVGLMPENLVDIQIEHLRENLIEMSNYILAVECVDESFFRYSCTSQRVNVEYVFKGEDVKQGDCIEIIRGASALFFDEAKPSINMGFVNEMKQGKRYLIFLDRELENTKDIYVQNIDFMLAPIFCYEDKENSPQKPDSRIGNVIDYKKVQNNEFFFIEESSYEKMQVLKEELFALYNFK